MTADSLLNAACMQSVTFRVGWDELSAESLRAVRDQV